MMLLWRHYVIIIN